MNHSSARKQVAKKKEKSKERALAQEISNQQPSSSTTIQDIQEPSMVPATETASRKATKTQRTSQDEASSSMTIQQQPSSSSGKQKKKRNKKGARKNEDAKDQQTTQGLPTEVGRAVSPDGTSANMASQQQPSSSSGKQKKKRNKKGARKNEDAKDLHKTELLQASVDRTGTAGGASSGMESPISEFDLGDPWGLEGLLKSAMETQREDFNRHLVSTLEARDDEILAAMRFLETNIEEKVSKADLLEEVTPLFNILCMGNEVKDRLQQGKQDQFVQMEKKLEEMQQESLKKDERISQMEKKLEEMQQLLRDHLTVVEEVDASTQTEDQ